MLVISIGLGIALSQVHSEVVQRCSQVHRIALWRPANIAISGEFFVVVFCSLWNILPTQIDSGHLNDLILIIHASDCADFLLCFFKHGVTHWCGVFTIVESSCLGEQLAQYNVPSAVAGI